MVQKNYYFNYYLIALILAIITEVHASIPNFKIEHTNSKVWFHIELNNSKIYWVYAGDHGLPTSIDLSESDNLLQHQIIWPFPLYTINADNNSIERYYYTGALTIPVHIAAINKDLPVLLKANLTYLVCKDQCIPVTQRLEQRIVANADLPYQLSSFDVSNISYTNHNITFTTSFSEPIYNIPDFAVNQLDTNFIKDTSVTRKNNNEFLVKFFIDTEKHHNIKGRSFEIYSNRADVATKFTVPETKNILLDYGFCIALLSAFIGGFILNFMPCVLPVLSLKLLSFTKNSSNKKLSLALSLFGIILTFLALALVSIGLKLSGKQFGIGMHFQNSEFIIFLTIIITIFISSCLDRINIDLPFILRNTLNK